MSDPIDLGEHYSGRINTYDAAGVPGDAGAVPVVVITLPDGTTKTSPTDFTVTDTGAGQYDFDYLTVQAGRHYWLATATGGVLGSLTQKFEGVFDVEIPGAVLVSVDEAVRHLRAGGIITSTTDLEQLRWLCSVATDAVERDLGRVITRRTIIETYDGGQPGILLRSTPVISVTTVVESTVTLTAADYTLDVNSGILYRGTSLTSRNWAWGRQNVVVTEIAGYMDPPRIARKVALAGVQRMWQSSQQMPHPALGDVVGGGGFAETAFLVAAGGLTPMERSAYDSLRAPGMA